MIKIYCIKDLSGQIVYVGQTKRELSERYFQHKFDENHLSKASYLQDVSNGCYIELLEECQDWEARDCEQYWIDEYYSPRANFFNKIRAKRMTDIEKYCFAKVLKKQNNTIDGTFEFDDSDEDLFN